MRVEVRLEIGGETVVFSEEMDDIWSGDGRLVNRSMLQKVHGRVSHDVYRWLEKHAPSADEVPL